jgi:hypothetical protein
MTNTRFLLIIILIASVSSCTKEHSIKDISSDNVYSDEYKAVLGRGIISYLSDSGHGLLNWRLLPEDPKGGSFNIYRKEIGNRDENYKWIARTDRTSYTDRDARGKRYAYAVRTFHKGKEGDISRESIVLSSIGGKAALIFDIGQHYKQARMVTGDLNGDGEPEVVVAYSGHPNVDAYSGGWSKSKETIKVTAFLPTGERLWTLDLGWGIEAGEDYQPMVVWDLDGDGRSEVILKTNKSSDPLDYEGERLTVLDGTSGRIKSEAKWPSLPWSPIRKKSVDLPNVPKGIWSDYNNDSRNYLAIAHLDGMNPYVISARGTYKSQKIWAFDRNLQRVWERNLGLDHHYSEGYPGTPMGLSVRLSKFWNIDNKMKYLWARLTKRTTLDQYRGTHSLPVSDINEDGKEEILWGERCIGETGNDLWAIKERFPYPGHPDVVLAGHIMPSQKGKQVYFTRESGGAQPQKIGMYLVDHQGKILWGHWGYHHIDQGWVSRIIADLEGMQCLGVDIVDKLESATEPWKLIEPRAFLWNSDGKLIGNPPASFYSSVPIDWDGDGVREIVFPDNGIIQKYGGPVMEKLSANILWGADLFGDHREEIIAAPGDGKIYIFSNTTDVGSPARVTPMADRQYKNDLSRTAMQASRILTEGGYIPRKLRGE